MSGMGVLGIAPYVRAGGLDDRDEGEAIRQCKTGLSMQVMRGREMVVADR